VSAAAPCLDCYPSAGLSVLRGLSAQTLAVCHDTTLQESCAYRCRAANSTSEWYVPSILHEDSFVTFYCSRSLFDGLEIIPPVTTDMCFISTTSRDLTNPDMEAALTSRQPGHTIIPMRASIALWHPRSAMWSFVVSQINRCVNYPNAWGGGQHHNATLCILDRSDQARCSGTQSTKTPLLSMSGTTLRVATTMHAT
jgi:hypothetical protein